MFYKKIRYQQKEKIKTIAEKIGYSALGAGLVFNGTVCAGLPMNVMAKTENSKQIKMDEKSLTKLKTNKITEIKNSIKSKTDGTVKDEDTDTVEKIKNDEHGAILQQVKEQEKAEKEKAEKQAAAEQAKAEEKIAAQLAEEAEKEKNAEDSGSDQNTSGLENISNIKEIYADSTGSDGLSLSVPSEYKQKAQENTDKTKPSGYTYSGAIISKSAGTVQGPSGKETYYNLPMSGVVSIMRSMGFDEENYPYHVREDGVKMLGDYVMVAADLSLRPRGSLIMTSVGVGLVCDTGSFAYSNHTQLDIATAW